MAAQANPEHVKTRQPSILIRLSRGRSMRLVWRRRPRVSRLLAALLAACLPSLGYALDGAALPTGGQIRTGSGQIQTSGTTMTVRQDTSRLGLDWQSFSIGGQARVDFQQPGSDAIALNRIVGNSASEIYGRLTANGQVFLSNPNGVLFAPGAKVDVGGLVATTLDLTQVDFAAGNYRFQAGGTGTGVTNQGEIHAAQGGYVALFASQASNAGVIHVPGGSVLLASGKAVTVDITGSGLISAVIQEGVSEGKAENTGVIQADGGLIRMDAKSAAQVASGLVNNTGILRADSLVEKNGEIWLSGDTVTTTGQVRAIGENGQKGGEIHVEGVAVALGGMVNADGADGGRVHVVAGSRLSLAETVSAQGTSGAGGEVVYVSGGGVLESGTSHTDVGGKTDGGRIAVHAASGIASSGHYDASGEAGQGGRVDMSGDSVHLLSARIDVSGSTQGGLVRIGGEFQGGATPTVDAEVAAEYEGRWGETPTLAAADKTFLNDGVRIDVSASAGAGGTAIVWSQSETTFLGGIDARGTSGGAVEISSAGTLRRAELANLQVGEGGQVLLDPKDLNIGDPATLKAWMYQGVLESVYAWKASVPVLDNNDHFGSSVALSGNGRLLAAGAPYDDGAGNSKTDSGAVHLFGFSDGDFSGASLLGTLGDGYLGGRNVNVSLDASDLFGISVSLNSAGNRLAVGSLYDDGFGNSRTDAGAVYLFTFTDTGFSGGALAGIVGHGYSGTGDVNVSLDTSDNFGRDVSLNGTGNRLVVGAPYDDGYNNSAYYDRGAVYLFTFGDNNFGAGAKVGTIGHGYAGAGDFNLSLDGSDAFGWAVSLNATGDRLAVGAPYDDGYNNSASYDRGAVYLFAFSDANFSGGARAGTLGQGYANAGDVSIGLDSSDHFGWAVALNNTGDRLLVGAPYDDGYNNSRSETGAVHLFTFTDTSFGGGAKVGTLGAGYSGTTDVDIALDNSDYFGLSVAPNALGDRLAVGANWDDGANDDRSGAGAVHLFSFADQSFSAGQWLGRIGYGYSDERGNDVDLDGGSRSGDGDGGGVAVALNANARLLAIGAPGDDGAAQGALTGYNTGAVHLVTFADTDFGGGALVGSIGEGYAGGKNVNVDLGNGDAFGTAVALNASGNRLAVGAPNDDGYNDVLADTGAVHLINFADTSFGGGSRVGVIGHGYVGTGDLSITLDNGDAFGWSVALNGTGNRLAVGAYRDDAYSNNIADSGAVHLFTFSDGSFGGGARVGTIGHGYTGTGDLNISLDQYDNFGGSVALNATGDRMAAGAFLDDGYNNSAYYDRGAVHLITFTDGNFGGGIKVGTIGYGYTGAGDINVGLDDYDYFGRSLALNAVGDRLAVGSPYDRGYLNGGNYRSGAVLLFRFSDVNFGGGIQTGTIGQGYTGSGDVEVLLDSYDYLGTSVALNAAGDRLAVGSDGDDGQYNNHSDSGAVHLFTFNNTSFGDGLWLGRIGRSYSNEKGDGITLDGGSRSGDGDYAGSAVALNDNASLLAIGAPGDDGAEQGAITARDTGAVHLVTFSDTDFGGGALVGSIGEGYMGGKNVHVDLDTDDQFGAAVALNAAGDRLAVGAYQDDGLDNNRANSGAVHLFAFTDTSFGGGSRSGIIGHGYSGPGNVNISLDTSDYFGRSVALNGTGSRLAVGATEDDGYNNARGSSGAVHLFTFSDGNFSGGSQAGTLGYGYVGALDVNVALDSSDDFGQGVALNAAGDRLAVGVPNDDGFDNSNYRSGAVHLFTFVDGNFNGGTQVGTIGSGYVGSGDVNVPQDNYYYMGYSVALNASGNRLAVGTPYDSGYNSNVSYSGAVQLFAFTDTNFGGGVKTGTVGHGYTGTGDVNVSLDSYEYFGWSVALNGAGDRLAVGAPRDDGYNNSRTESGAVHLFSFADTDFGGGAVSARIGHGYGNRTQDVALNLLANDSYYGDQMGQALALSANARLMAIGSPLDDGAGIYSNESTDQGAVHLVTFSDSDFGGGVLVGTIGDGYTGGKNVNVSLGDSDNFGFAVALNAAGDRLAVGARYDDGYNDSLSSSGAVHLFTFADTSFSGGFRVGAIGSGYAGTGDVNISLGGSDYFGWSVALNAAGDRLAVGAPYDDGFNNSASYSGAVYLFTFTNSSFAGGANVGTIGYGYAGTGDINVALDSSDHFGWSVALNAAGDRLAVGTPYDRGFGNTQYASGAVHLFTFSDGDFGGGAKSGTIGLGYTGTGDISISLDGTDLFGTAVALNATGNQLAVGAPYDDGFGNSRTRAGAVHLFTFSDGNFGGGARSGTAGYGYVGTGDINVTLDSYDGFGTAVAMNGSGDRLAVGAPQDDGLSNAFSDSGAVHLFTFSGSGFTGGAQTASGGRGYGGIAGADEQNWESYFSHSGDQAGTAVALSDDARLLAVGAPYDRGAQFTSTASYGAVHLIAFSDGDFNDGTLVGTLGAGYSGGKNVDVSLENGDQFGAAVALNGSGNRLAVGAPEDDGFGNARTGSGAVYLFTFTDTSFSGGSHVGTVGDGYAGASDINVTLGTNDNLGAAVALNGLGNRLAAGAPEDDGFNNARYTSGAVHLFTFTDNNFGGGARSGTVGYGYVGTGDLNLAIDTSDDFGRSVALNGAGNLLAVGAPYDDGYANTQSTTGSVYLIAFSNTDFGGGNLNGVIGDGYLGVGDVHIGLDNSNYFGWSVALNAVGDRLAVGAPYDDGRQNSQSSSGAVRLFTFSDTNFGGGAKAGTIGYGYAATGDVDLSLDGGDLLGWSVALNGAGDRLAVGSPRDDGDVNLNSYTGAVHLLRFADQSFGGGALAGIVGAGYHEGARAGLSPNWEGSASEPTTGDRFGSALALSADGTLFAVGAPGDDGSGDQDIDTGAVHLFHFTDLGYLQASLVGTVGKGYTGGGNLSVDLENGDAFGASVALNADASLMAVGATGDDGAGDDSVDTGAVYLFRFSGANLTAASQAGIIGDGYGGAGNVNVVLDSNDNFGAGVALNAAGNWLAVGAPQDDGYSNGRTNSGAVHLFTFGDTNFSNGARAGSIGYGYAGTGDLNFNADNYDQFGTSVALNGAGDRLAVGAPRDGGYNNALTYSGAVHLFTFADTSFGGGTLVGSIGHGYAGTGDVNISLDNSDYFGGAVALNANGDRLAVGAVGDDGFGDSYSGSGAVRLFTFTDSNFSGGSQVGTLGRGYGETGDVDLYQESSDSFGSAVALDATGGRLLVGASQDDGQANDKTYAGAVRLISFTNTAFAGGASSNIIGDGYQRLARLGIGLDWEADISEPSTGDRFGTALALSGDGGLLAVGATGDDGYGERYIDSGAVHLFRFTDTGYLQATLVGSIGQGYVGGGNVSIDLDTGDQFGSSVALSANGQAMAVGAPGDDGADDGHDSNLSDSGAVHLFTFSDSQFGGGTHVSTLGHGYTGGANVNVTLEPSDNFGAAVALNAIGNRLAVGALGDDGSSNSRGSSGAVYLFTFTDNAFAGGGLSGRMGYGYAGSGDVNVSTNSSDNFGSAVALNATGDRLAVGARYDDGFNNNLSSSGAVYLFTFSDANFSGGTHAGTIGHGYVGTGDADITLDSSDYFGSSVALSASGERLAVGAPLDDGHNNASGGSGAVHMFAFTDTSFGGGALTGSLGYGYSEAGGLSVSLDSSDQFGGAVAMNAAGDRLAVGSPQDDGIENAKTYSGAVRVFALAGAGFANGQQLLTLGDGRLPRNSGFSSVNTSDRFGSALALRADALRLAIGAPGDDGFSNDRSEAGAVYLYGFSDGNYGGASLMSTLGYGYSGGKNLDVSLDWGDNFGSALAFDATGTRLAVGAQGDDGHGNIAYGSGAVHLLSFSDGDFSTPTQVGMIGSGYTGTGNLNISLDSYDAFGAAVALNNAGTRMVVGAPQDDGQADDQINTGAVYLISFADANFGSPTLSGTLGYGYSGSGDLSVSLDSYDYFGTAVALNGAGDRLAVGTPGDDTYDNYYYYSSSYAYGAVHLFTFTDTDFGGGALAGSIGHGYAGPGDVNISLSSYHRFGSAVALNDAGTILAVGKPGDSNYYSYAGAVHLFEFNDGNFASGQLTNTFGSHYSGIGELDVARLRANDGFGGAVALDGSGDHLVAGAPGHDTVESHTLADTGAVFLFEAAQPPTGDPATQTFAANSDAEVAVDVSALAALLAGGTSVTLQANNDLFLLSDLVVGGSTGGNLVFQAGRSVQLLGSISTANGNFSAKANALVSDGVINAERDSGNAVISMATGTQIDAGMGSVTLTLAEGTGLTYNSSGDIALEDVSGSAITVENLGPTSGSDLVLNGQLAATGDIVLATVNGEFDNYQGSNALTSTGGRWLVYTGSPGGSYEHGLVAAAGASPRFYNMTYTGNPPSGIAAGNHFLYRSQPTLTLGADDQSVTYGDADPSLTYSASGLVNDDGVVDTLAYAGVSTPSPSLATVSGRRAVGDYTISLNLPSNTSSAGYAVTGADGTLTVQQRTLSLAGLAVSNKTYDGTTAAVLASVGTLTGVLSGDTVTVDTGTASASFADKNAGNGKTVTLSGLVLSGAEATNYMLTTASTTASVLRKSLTVTGVSANNKTYDGTTAATLSSFGTLNGFVGGETVTLVTSASSAAFSDKNAGTGKTVSVHGLNLADGDNGGLAANYSLTLPTATADIIAKSLSATGGRQYDGTSVVTAADLTLPGMIAGDDLSLAGNGGVASKNVASGLPLSLGSLTLNGADAGNYVLQDGSFDITPRILTVTGLTAADKVYDGTTSAVFSGSPSLSGLVGGDLVSADISGAGVAFVDKNAGAGKAVTMTGIVLTGADAGNYATGTNVATATITPLALNITAQAQDKVYDGTRTASVTFTDNRLGGDLFNITGAGLFDNKNVGAGKTVSISGITLSGADASNYSYATTALDTADITPRTLNVSTVVQNKVYDGTILATVIYGDDRIAGDDLTLTTGSATFTDKNVGAGKTVTLGGVTLSGGDVGNYSFTPPTSGTADITPRPLNLLASAADKVYDGTTVVSVSYSDNRIAGDDLSRSIAAAAFVDKNAGVDKVVNVTGVAYSGADAGNYSYASSLVTLADITKKPLVATGVSIADKVYDGTVAANITAGSPSLSGVISGDSVAVDLTGASVVFADKNVGTGKNVFLSGFTLTGTDAGNYQTQSSLGSASITPRTLNITATAQDKVYDGTTLATVLYGDDRIAGDLLSVTSNASFADKNVGAGKTVNMSGILLSGADAGNYSPVASISNTADITPRPLGITATALDKVYDGTTSAQVSLGDDRIAGDLLSLAYATATFGDKNAGLGKPVGIGGITLTGTDALNYTYATSATSTADIDRRPVTILGLTAADKVYDGTTVAVVSGSASVSGLITGDDVTVDTNATSVAFADKNAGQNKAVVMTGIALAGADAANYLPQATVDTADISPLGISAAGTRLYDGSDLVAAADLTLAGLIIGDVVNLGGSGALASKNVGSGLAVAAGGLTLNGVDALNYQLGNVSFSVTPRPVTAQGSREYDGTTNAAGSSFSLANAIAGDAIALGGLGSVASKNVGSGLAVNLGSLALTGVDASNYLLQSTGYEITPRHLTISGLTAADKVYDGTTLASVTGTATLSGVIAGDSVSVDTTASTVVFSSKDAGSGIQILMSGLALSGADAGNYAADAIAGTAAITPRSLTLSGLTVANKVYDGTTVATVSSYGSLAGLVAGEGLNLDTAGVSAAFDSKNVGNDKPVSLVGLALSDGPGGGLAANYSLALPAASANITPRPLTAQGSREYDGTTLVSAASLSLPGAIGGDDIGMTGSGGVASKNVGAGLAVIPGSLALGGADVANYLLLSTTFAITPRHLMVSGLTTADKVYDGTTLATITGTGTLSGVISGDDVSVDTSATGVAFADKNAGSNKQVLMTGLVLAGADAANYSADAIAGTATIAPRTLSVSGLSIADKIYDGSTAASVAGSPVLAGLISGDVVTVDLAGSSAIFEDKQAGTGKSVLLTGIALNGSDAGNYSAQASAGAASILPRDLHYVVTALDKVFDGTPTAMASFTDDRVAGDILDYFYTANFANVNVGVNVPATITGVGLAGADAGNYNPTGGSSGSADITPRSIYVAADNVVRFADEANPSPFAYSVGQGGLVGGDSLATVDIPTPAGSVAAPGGSVFNLKPSNATFLSGNLSNYTLNYVNGLLVVLPSPEGNETSISDASDRDRFILALTDEQEKARDALPGEFSRLSTMLLQNEVPAPPAPTQNTGMPLDGNGERMDVLLRRMLDSRDATSNQLITVLRSQPLLLWTPIMPSRLLRIEP